MENENDNDIIVAYVTMRTRSGLSIHKDIRKLSLSTIELFRPNPKHLDIVVDLLTEAGFKIVARTSVGISISGPKKLFESEFKVKIRRKEKRITETEQSYRKDIYYESSRTFMTSPRIERYAESVHLSSPAISMHNAVPPPLSQPYYHLNVLTDVPELLNVCPLHTAGIKGMGVSVIMVDTGFVTRVTEQKVHIINVNVITVNHTVRDVQGVWVDGEEKNYFTQNGSFIDNTITLGTSLKSVRRNVTVTYSCLHPHYLSQNYNISDIRAADSANAGLNIDINTDENGHGTAMAANLLAIAPDCTFSLVKYESYPVAGFETAFNQNPKIISCSWVVTSKQEQDALTFEVVSAVSEGVVVIFAAGNNGEVRNDSEDFPISDPAVISIGGAYPNETYTSDIDRFQASDYSSSYDSHIYVKPQRHCPDVVGLVGQTENKLGNGLLGRLIMLPTEPSSIRDYQFHFIDHTDSNDGWIVTSGTSAATQQAAGVVALLLQKYPDLTPMAVKNILENSARDIVSGKSAAKDNNAPSDYAAPGWDPATGFGLIDGLAAINYLIADQFSPFIRDCVEDNGTQPVVAVRLFTSPDIIVLRESVNIPQDELGLTVKHRFDLCDKVEDGQDNYIYLRIQNRGTVTGDCTATVFFTDPGMFSNPTAWTTIGQLNIQDLNPGEFRVAGPLVWPDGLIPGSGHYCLIAVLDSKNDPAPDLTCINSTIDFIDMVRNSNKVAWRNIDVEDIIPGGSSSWSFYMEGPFEDGRQTDLQININNFPNTGTVLVKVDKRIMDKAILDQLMIVDHSQIFTTLKHVGGIGELQCMNLKYGEKAKVTIYYSIPAKTPAGIYSMVATLLIDGNSVNSYTKIVNVITFAYVVDRQTLEIHKRGCPWLSRLSSYDKMPIANLKQARKYGFGKCATCIGGSKR